MSTARPFGTLLLAAALAAGSLACHPAPPRGAPAADAPAWPPPPDPARIRYVTTVRTPRDLGIRRGAFRRFVDWAVRGRRQVGLVRPFDVASTPAGRLAVADPDAHAVHLYDPERNRYLRIKEIDGQPLLSPIGVAPGPEESFFVADSARARVFRIDARGRSLGEVGSLPELRRPTGLAYDAARHLLWIVDTKAHRLVRLDTSSGESRAVGRRGTGRGEFNYPVSAAVGADGRVYVADSMNFRVQILDAEGRFLNAFGRAGAEPGSFDKMKGLAVDSAGDIYVVDTLHDVIQVFDSSGALLTVLGGSGAGAGEFWLPAGIHIDAEDRIYVADSANRRLQILRFLGRPARGDDLG